ncbi:MAG: Stp1/IreP family PP2C-type Ser/Thr phosphatase [Roseburia sp.]|nr:Stp1/IreP family PP2C-type Ser/Thr phosphatase [Roseburia sp.]MBQ8518704.1 Stp1/IreP family PP2C-type Ser/Thr phosphatase [Agathobacter sp.]
MKTFSITDTGALRTMNQDYCFSSDTPIGNLPNLYIVCDGMGGHKAGEYASRYTVERIVAHASRSRSENPIRILRDAIQKANEILVIESREDAEKQGMGTTVVAATILDHKMYVANVGDSRLYVIGETIEQITKDHSYVEEMVRMGKVDPADARKHEKKNVITRAVGVTEKVKSDIFEVELQDNDTVLLCTDGLSNMVTDERILEIVLSNVHSENIARKLVDEANKNGGQDNITAVVLRPYHDEVK